MQVISSMRVMMTEDSSNGVSSSFLLDDDSRYRFFFFFFRHHQNLNVCQTVENVIWQPARVLKHFMLLQHSILCRWHLQNYANGRCSWRGTSPFNTSKFGIRILTSKIRSMIRHHEVRYGCIHTWSNSQICVCLRSLLLSLSLIIIFWPVKLYIFHYNLLAPFQQRGGRY